MLLPVPSQACLFPDVIFIFLFILLLFFLPVDGDLCPLEFHGLDEATLLRALQALQQEHKAEIIMLDDGRGVKFF